MARKLLVLFNPQARAGGDAGASARFEGKLRRAGFEVSSCAVDARGVESAVATSAAGCSAIVIGGGDGSVRSAIAPALAAQLPIAVWPLGTANDFARSLHIETEDDCVEALAAWSLRSIDVAAVNGTYFVNNATLGLPAEATARLTGRLKSRLGVLAVVALVPTLWRHAKPFDVEIAIDGRIERRTIVAALVGNGIYQGGFPVRYTGLSDGTLHLAVCRARSRWAIFPILFDACAKRLGRSRRVETFSARQASIRTATPKRIGADGDIVTETPADVVLHGSALQVFYRPAAV